MKKFNLKKYTSFAKGIVVGATVCILSISAFAASGTVSFNGVNINLNSLRIASEGEYFEGGNGAEIPTSIQYTNENGGITSYIPLRSFTDSLGMPMSLSGEDGMPTTSNIKDINVLVEGYYEVMTLPSEYSTGITIEAYKAIEPKITSKGGKSLEKQEYISENGVPFEKKIIPDVEDGKYVSISVTNNSNYEYLKLNAGFEHYSTTTSVTGEKGNKILIQDEVSSRSNGRTLNELKIAPQETKIVTYEIVGTQEEVDLMPIDIYVGLGENLDKVVDTTISVTQFN